MSGEATEPKSASVETTVVLERDVALSQSVLWRKQRDYYAGRGARVWAEDAVPSFITSNPFIAELYASIAVEFIHECSGKPVRILELGAGTGKFAFLFLKRLGPLLDERGIPKDRVRYCMADCSPSLLETWRGNERLAPFVSTGRLEFDLWRAGEEEKLRWMKESPAPLLVIANYVFDSLPQDAFVVKDGELFETLVTTSAAEGDAMTSQFQLAFRNAQVPEGRYREHRWHRTLESYRSLPSATLSFPVEALLILSTLRAIAGNDLLALVADKGFVRPEELALAQGPPSFEFHGAGCFSQMVNLDAIARDFEIVGGEALLPDKYSALRICGFLSRSGFARTVRAYREAQHTFGPEDVFTLLAWLHSHIQEMTVPQVLAVLRLTRWDPVALMQLFAVLAPQLPSAGAYRADLRSAVLRAWENYYPISVEENEFPFRCGAVLLSLGFHADAEPMFQQSLRVLGPSAATSFNLSLCASGLGRTADALALMEQACVLDPKFEPAQSARRKLRASVQP